MANFMREVVANFIVNLIREYNVCKVRTKLHSEALDRQIWCDNITQGLLMKLLKRHGPKAKRKTGVRPYPTMAKLMGMPDG